MKTPGAMVAEVLRSLFRRPVTTTYPAEKPVIPDRFRGKIRYYAAKCIGCKLCVKSCPSAGAITITQVGEKRFQAEFRLDRCIYCAQCVDSCPTNALESTPEFELAQLERSKFEVIFHAEPVPESKAASSEKASVASLPPEKAPE